MDYRLSTHALARISARDTGQLAGDVTESDEVREGMVFDYDAEGRVLGIEILDVSKRADNPTEVAFEMLAA
jgi:YD repeat-containing protein